MAASAASALQTAAPAADILRTGTINERAPRFSVKQNGNIQESCGALDPASNAASGFSRCPFDDTGMGLAMSLRQEAEFGVIETHGFFARGSDGALAPWRQMVVSNLRGMNEESTLAVFGIKTRLLDGRLRLTTNFGWGDRWTSQLAQSPLFSRRGDEQTTSARLLRFEFDAITRPGLRWTLAGESSRAAETFGYGQVAMLYQGDAFMPGQRTAVSTSLKLGQWRLTAGADEHETSFGDSATRKLGLAGHGLSLSFKMRRSSVSPTLLAGGTSSRTSGSSFYMDVDTAELFSSLASGRKGLRLLLPASMSINLSNTITHADDSAGLRSYRRRGFELFGNWETPLGETTFGFSRDTRRGLSGVVRDNTERTFQASHMVRKGGWRFGIDGVLVESDSPNTTGYRDRSVMLGQTIAYSRMGGPEFMLRIGQDHIRSSARDGTYTSAIRASRLTATLDMTQFLRRRLKRQDIALKLEYRRRLDDGEYNYTSFDDVLERITERDERQGLLLTFRMKLR